MSSEDCHNSVNQLYFNLKMENKKKMASLLSGDVASVAQRGQVTH